MTLTFGYTITNATQEDLDALVAALKRQGHGYLAEAIEGAEGQRTLEVSGAPTMTPEGVESFNAARTVTFNVGRRP